jgi:hypothetical protein
MIAAMGRTISRWVMCTLVALLGCADGERERPRVQAVGSASLDAAIPIDAAITPHPDAGYIGEVVLPDADEADPGDASMSSGMKLLADRVAESPIVVVGTCSTAVPRFAAETGDVVTDVSLTIDRVLVGAASAERLDITVIGGMLEDRGTMSPHSGRYEAGGSYILFLWTEGDTPILGKDYTSSARLLADRVEYQGYHLSYAEVRGVLPTL